MLSSQLKGEIEIPGDVETKFLIMIFVLKTNFACWTAHKKNSEAVQRAKSVFTTTKTVDNTTKITLF